MRLKSRNKFPPGEFQLLLPETGMKESVHGSFDEVVNAFALIVKKNPALAQKQGWPDDRAGQENFVEDQNARRLMSAGWSKFVEVETQAAPISWTPSIDVKKNPFGKVVQRAKAAVSAYEDLFINGPVESSLSESRAKVCSVCPKNNTKDSLTDIFVESAASAISSLISFTRSKNLTTSLDDKLGICEACGCPMKAKVHVRVDELVKSMPKEDYDALSKENPVCWIRSESE